MATDAEREYHRRYRAANADRIREQRREKYLADHEARKLRLRESHANNREARRAAMREYAAKNSAAAVSRVREWRAKPENHAALKSARNNHNNKRRNLQVIPAFANRRKSNKPLPKEGIAR